MRAARPAPIMSGMRTIGLILIVLSGCAGGQGWRHVDRATLALSTIALVADGFQTRSASERGWSHGDREANPLLGATPSSGRVEVYFASTIVTNAVLWAVLPPKWRSIVPVAVVGFQAQTIRGNLETTCVMGIGRASRC